MVGLVEGKNGGGTGPIGHAKIAARRRSREEGNRPASGVRCHVEVKGSIGTHNVIILKQTRYAQGSPEIRTTGDYCNLNSATNKDAYLGWNVPLMKLFREPRSGIELRSSLGLVNFFPNLVEFAADKMAPLYKVLEGTRWNKKKKR